MTVPMWIYWRLWILTSVVMYSIAFDANQSLWCIHATRRCRNQVYIEKFIFLSLLGTLLILHMLWIKKLAKLGYRELAEAVGKEKFN